MAAAGSDEDEEAKRWVRRATPEEELDNWVALSLPQVTFLSE